mmetsp:Transcript_13148/g.24994  ORF Transcript_13148/g.24994 Transcript_13148/m.24994 type:complete len:106 (-) Transcript_13148:581-898(-)
MIRGNSALQRKEAITASNEFIREIANEPSLGLYYVQEHVAASVPKLMEVKSQFKECTKETHKEIHSLNNSVYSVKHFGGVVPKHLNTIKQKLEQMNARLASKINK